VIGPKRIITGALRVEYIPISEILPRNDELGACQL